MTCIVSQDGADVLVSIKVVPGASRDALAGVLGDRLKIRVGAPPEGGKANAAVIRLLEATLGRGTVVDMVSGHGSPRKQVRIHGTTADAVRSVLGVDS